MCVLVALLAFGWFESSRVMSHVLYYQKFVVELVLLARENTCADNALILLAQLTILKGHVISPFFIHGVHGTFRDGRIVCI